MGLIQAFVINIYKNLRMKDIIYRYDIIPEVGEIIHVYNSSGIRRPTGDEKRIEMMYKNSNLVVSAWHRDRLVGIARSLTDYCYCCYLSDLAVRKEYQGQGIGKKLVELTREKIGPQSMLLLLSAPNAMTYYPGIGFENVNNGFIINRKY